MFEKITVEEAINMENKIFIDVRSSEEFLEGSIFGSINIPILDNQERSVVGTIYKQISSDEAKIKGIEYASSKLPYIYKEVLTLSKKYKNIILFCWRGGLRSGTVSNFLSTLGIKVYQLDGGYKAYRNHIIKYFNKENFKHKFIVLHGYTGVGKTEILEKLEKLNIPTLNLEKLIKNSGSVFGSVIYQNENSVTQKAFESAAFEVLRLSNSKYIVTESEGQRLGGITLPEGLFSSIVEGYHILINASLEYRIDRLVDDYVNKVSNCDILLQQSILNLKKRIGLNKVNQCILWIKEKQYEKVAKELIVEYYDPLYIHSINNYNYMMEINSDNIEDALDNIIKVYSKLEHK